VRQAFGVWGLLRYESRLFRWSPTTHADDETSPEVRLKPDTTRKPDATWLGNTTVRGRSFHALFCPEGSDAAYRFVAPPHSRIVAWCGLLPNAQARGAAATFNIAVTRDAAPGATTSTVRLTATRFQGDHGWRKVVVDVGNRRTEQIDIRLTTETAAASMLTGPWAVWGEPRLEWPHQFAEVVELIRFVSGPALRGRLITALRLLHRRLSSSTNRALYHAWLARQTPSPDDLDQMHACSERFRYRPLISVVTPVFNTDPRWLRACIESVRHQAYPNWQLCLADDGSTRKDTRRVLEEYADDPRIRIDFLKQNVGIAAASNAALALAEGDFVAFLDHDDELTPDALFAIVSRLNSDPEADFLYSDEDKLEVDGSFSGPYFKPAWSPEHFLTNMYTCHMMVVRRDLIEQVGGFRPGYEGAQDYDLVLRLMEHTSRIHHVPKVLYHWRKIPESTAGIEGAKPWAHDAGRLALEDYVRRNRVEAEVLPGAYPYVYRVRFAIRGEPLISIIPAPGLAPPSIEQWRDTLSAGTRYRHFELVATVGQARGEHFLYLDPRLRPLGDEWLTALLEFSQQDPIGAVGAKLLYADGSLKHIGLLPGVNGTVAPAFHRHPRSSLGYWGTAIAARNYSAVSGDCLMTRRTVFEAASGFTQECGTYADVDYCLRVRAAGYRIVFTPHAVLTEYGPPDPITRRETRADASRLRTIWGERLLRDPYYNQNLSRETPDYEPDLSAAASGAKRENAETAVTEA
jgi:O-antigen biosynthesis protein